APGASVRLAGRAVAVGVRTSPTHQHGGWCLMTATSADAGLEATGGPAGAGRPAGLGLLVDTELLKLRTTRVWWGLLITGVLLAFVNSGLLAGTAGMSLGNGAAPSPTPRDPAMLRSIYTGGFSYGYVIALCLGVLGMAGEYRHQTITPTLLAVPRRGRLVAAKLVAYMLAGLGYGIVIILAGGALGAVIVAARGYPLGLGASGVARALVLSMLGCALWAVFGLGVGTLIRNQIVALFVAIAVAVLIAPLLAFGLQAAHAGSVAQYLPNQASAALVQGTNGGIEQQLLPWWGGLLVLLAYGVVFAVLGAALTTRRDIT
ncbi:MAG: ABC transporter permease, partial [Kineosporiaceae bacterium]